jgi:fibronectin type 3 domain-containing protein
MFIFTDRYLSLPSWGAPPDRKQTNLRIRAIEQIMLMAFFYALILVGSALAQSPAAPIQEMSYKAAISGDYAVVGAPWHDGYKGAAYLYRREGAGWVQVQKLSPPDLGSYDHFGGSVSIDGDVVVVGAAWQDLFSGAAYVFTRAGDRWVQSDKLTAGKPAPESYFGHEVLVEGSGILVAEGETPDALRFESSAGRWLESGRTGRSIPRDAGKSAPSQLAASILGGDQRNLVAAFGDENADLPADPGTPVVAPLAVTATGGGDLDHLEPEVRITWEPGEQQDAIIYMIWRDTAPLAMVSSNETQYSDETAVFGQTHDYCVVVKDMDGNVTDEVCAEGSRIIFAPIDLVATDGEFTDKVHLEWIDVSLINTGYIIRRDGAELARTGPGSTSYNDETATPMEVYSYEVVAYVDGDSESLPAPADSGWVDTIFPPLNVQATDGNYTDRVLVSWQIHQDADPTRQYVIYRDDLIPPLATTEANATSFMDTTAAPNTTYTYCVATKKPGSGAAGVPLSFQSTFDPSTTESIRICDEGGTVLDAPTAVAASDSTYDDRIRIEWQDNSSVEDGFEITRFTDPDYVVVDTTAANTNYYDDFEVVSDIPVVYFVRAVTAVGGASDSASDEGFRSTILAPFEVAASDSTFEDHVLITWTTTSTTTELFRIYRDDEFIKSVSMGDRSYRDYGGTAGQSYNYKVVAAAVAGEAESLPDAGARQLLAPTLFTVTEDEYEDKTLLSWEDNSQLEVGYLVSRESPGTARLDTLIGPQRTSFTDYKGAPGITYTYSVAAYDDLGGEVGYSDVVSGTGRRTLLPPTDLVADKGQWEEKITLSWRDNSDAEDGYRVYRDSLLIGTVVAREISFVDADPTLLQEHLYEVRAFDGWGESEGASDTGYTTLLAPASFNASDNYEDRIELTWVDRSGIEDGFRIYRDGAPYAEVDSNETAYTAERRIEEGLAESTNDLWDVFVAGDYAYAMESVALRIFDISDPAQPTLTGGVLGFPGYFHGVDVFVAGTHAFVAFGDYGLLTIDVSDPENPVLAGAVDTPGKAVGVYVAGNYAFVADDTEGLQIIDVSEPQNPELAAAFDTPGDASDVYVAGNYAYVADGGYGLVIIDITDPETPGLGIQVDTPGNAVGVNVAGNYAFVADDTEGLQVIDVSVWENSFLAGAVDTPGDALGVYVFGNYAFVKNAGEGENLQIIDVSDPENPSFAGAYDPIGDIRGIAVSGETAYLAEDLGLRCVPWSQHLSSETGSYEFSVFAWKANTLSEGSTDVGGFAVEDNTDMLAILGKLTPEIRRDDDYFGHSVSISGDRAIVGARGMDGVSGDGLVYIFEFDGNDWNQVAMFGEPLGGSGHWFGESVAIDEYRAIVGEPRVDAGGPVDSGAAWMYERGSDGAWNYSYRLNPPENEENRYFGSCVSLSGEYAIVGAHCDGAYDSGAAYVYKHDEGQWDLMTKLVASDIGPNTYFGTSVSLNGERAVVGSYSEYGGRGHAYVFELNIDQTGWVEKQKLTASDGASNDKFGCSVAMNDDRVIVGAYGDDNFSGSAYVFELNSDQTDWVEKQKLRASDCASGERFGGSVSINDNRVIVGAISDENDGIRCGSAYVFEFDDALDTWGQLTKLKASDGALNDAFGRSVSVGREGAIVGADGDDSLAGATYVFAMPHNPRNVAASDGSLESRVTVTWEDRSQKEQGFNVYRDGQLIGSTGENVEAYEDYDAEPGRTYTYGVAAMADEFVGSKITDFGWRPANGTITGRISTTAGAGAASVRVAVSTLPTRALQFDGSGGYVQVEDDSLAFAFGPSESYTVEAWVKYLGSTGTADETMIAKATSTGGQTRYPFVLRNMSGSSDPGTLVFAVSDSATTRIVSTTRSDINDNQWHHVACVHDAEATTPLLLIYIDGELDTSVSCAGLGDLDNDAPLTLGAGPDPDSWYDGLLDEIRIWNVARDETEIQASMAAHLTGDETGLVTWWPIGWPSGFQGEGSTNVITDMGSGAHYGELQGGAYFSEYCAPIDTDGITDLEGNFVIPGIFYGTNSQFEVRPYDGNKQFDPPVKRVALTTESPVENQVNFSDVSSFTVSGTIMYEGTDCAAANVPVYLDDQPAGNTDSRGKFAISTDLGEHTITPVLEGHDFLPPSRTVTVENDVSLNDATGVAFADTTKHTLTGRLGGGCGRYVGDIILTIRSENDCLLDERRYYESQGTFHIPLPPQNYLVSAAVDPTTIPDSLSHSDVVEYYQHLGNRLAPMDSLVVEMDFVYRAPLNVTITWPENITPACEGNLTFEGRTLPESLLVIAQLDTFTLAFEVNEDYGPSGFCALDSATILVYDEIRDSQNTPIELEVRDGVAHYTTFASTPNLLVGRVDEYGNDRSFQKSLRAVVALEGREPAEAVDWVLVTGHVQPEGADFVTGNTNLSMGVLRDPPGDGSYAFLEEGHTFRRRDEWDNNIFSYQAGLQYEARVGVKAKWFIGIGSGVIGENENFTTYENNTLFGNMYNEEHWTDITLTTKERISTSAENSFVGEKGDIYFGAGFNFIISEVGILDINENCEVTKTTSVGFEPDSISTLYTYTHQYIEDFLIPDLDQKIAHFDSLVVNGLAGDNEVNPEDSRDIFQAIRDDWKNTIDENRELKRREDIDAENRSFSAGAEFTYERTDDTTSWYSSVNTFVWDTSWQPASYSWVTNFGGITLGLLANTHLENIGQYHEDTHGDSQMVGYTLYDGDIGDHFTVDVKNDGQCPTPVFDVIAGASSCPYEPWPIMEVAEGDTTIHARMLARDKPSITSSPESRLLVPADQPAEFTLNLGNESETGEGRIYELRMITNSNPYGAVVKVGGVPLSAGVQEYFIDGGQSLEATLTVERGPSHYDYTDPPLRLLFTPACEYELWQADQRNLVQQADTLTIGVTFDAPCSDISLLEPQNGWVYDQAAAEASEFITIEATDYELDIGTDGSTIQQIGAQYRRLGTGETGPTAWQECVAPQVPDPGASETVFEWVPPEHLADGAYELRAYTQCQRGNGYSPVVTGTIARHGPLVLGTPQPSDGELSLGEDISITFNSFMDCQSVTDSGNVTLTYMSGPDSSSTIPFEAVCDGRMVVITPTAEANDMEGQRIQVSVQNLD